MKKQKVLKGIALFAAAVLLLPVFGEKTVLADDSPFSEIEPQELFREPGLAAMTLTGIEA